MGMMAVENVFAEKFEPGDVVVFKNSNPVQIYKEKNKSEIYLWKTINPIEKERYTDPETRDRYFVDEIVSFGDKEYYRLYQRNSRNALNQDLSYHFYVSVKETELYPLLRQRDIPDSFRNTMKMSLLLLLVGFLVL